MSVTSKARVETDRPERYRKQLATTTLTVEPGALVMLAAADDTETLDRVKDVTGRHPERFGEKDGPVVTWP